MADRQRVPRINDFLSKIKKFLFLIFGRGFVGTVGAGKMSKCAENLKPLVIKYLLYALKTVVIGLKAYSAHTRVNFYVYFGFFTLF